MQQYPIWHNVSACHYKTSKSYGGINTSEDNIVVGSSVRNSYQFVTTITTRRFYKHDVHGDVCVFKYSVDGFICKEMIFKDNSGKAGELLETISYLPV
jgi:hypothetical protein